MSPLPVTTQVSAGGIAFRQVGGQTEVALILVGPKNRWQLPKGAINDQESLEDAAQREVREEAGIETELLDLLDRIEYWFNAVRDGQRMRYHKFVYFYLMRYRSGDVNDHDHEVEEARWFPIEEAIKVLAFDSEKALMRKARARILSGQFTGDSPENAPTATES